MPETPSETWTTRKLLTWTTGHLERHGVDHARLAAEMLLGHVLGVERLRLYLDPDRPASSAERDRFRALIERATGHEPVDYLVGRAPFYGLELAVDRRVLIPRPSTEALVDAVIEHARSQGRPVSVLDVGTGSGAVALALAKSLADASVTATDVEAEALAVARGNAERLGLADRVRFVRGDLLGAVAGERFDVIASNPPYIPTGDLAGLDANVRDHEPHGALDGGVDGLACVNALIDGAADHLLPGGLLALEYNGGAQTSAVTERLGRVSGWGESRVLRDHEGLERVVCCVREAQGA
ncbi:peptide chain release factor N(5)-glutamine methyltransferase [Mucisphaera calidilacus]|uniref:Release factor glutamine methyltransferase n=1 Tax=Mucisphaera calidilacus TaxID=2527982 RepID=A0A518C1C6_9BACT|nr:peptide chain release factor N(5)-glutamine methyltransferase [Mucisphaera calidilacus]QDU73032.1 Release factor glutamine methyltransferase [Mucisphaera calidilacus]